MPVVNHAPAMKGISYTSFGQFDFSTGSQHAALDDAVYQLGADFVALNVFQYQESESSTEIIPTFQTSSDDDIRTAVGDARRLGMKVFLKVNVDVLHGRWRGYIVPDAAGAWFSAYTAMMLHYASLAESLQIEMLCVGCELVGATQARFQDRWRNLVATLRGHYSGSLVYAANWNGIADLNNDVAEYNQIQFWDMLDYVGVDLYPALAVTASEIPTQEQALQRISNLAASVASCCSRFNRRLIVCESGLASVRGALFAPWNTDLISDANAIHDEASQNLFYTTIIAAFGSQDWCEGVFWWNWESVETSVSAQNFTPRFKRAASTVKTWYGLPS